jgi:hypothetical protein
MSPTGFFDLKTPLDLREKLRHDLAELKASPLDTYRAFNFFVTAEHLLDWRLPGSGNQAARRLARETELLLQVTSHIANGAKHFITEAKHHKSIADTRRQSEFSGAIGAVPFGGSYLGGGVRYISLVIELDGDAASRFGQFLNVVDLAERVFGYWDAQVV